MVRKRAPERGTAPLDVVVGMGWMVVVAGVACLVALVLSALVALSARAVGG